MNEHPLTDEIIRYDKKLGCQDFGTWVYTENDLRAIADWQLEQVINWLNTTPHYHCPSVMAQMLQEAMRPTNTTTTQENNNG